MMAGILDDLQNTPVPSVPYSPSWTDQVGDWLNGTPGGLTSSSAYPTVNRLGLIGGGLQDAGAAIMGRQGGNLQALLQQNRDAANSSRIMQARQALAVALNGNDDGAKRAAVMSYIAAGGDPKDFLAASTGTLQDIGGTPVQRDPITGKVSVVQGIPRKPIISNGMQSTDNGQTWQPIPGYVDQQTAIYGGRRAGQIQAGPMPKAGGGGKKPPANFTPGTGNPASMF